MPKVRHKPMVALMLEEMLPLCRVEGISYIDCKDYEWEQVNEIPTFLEHLSKIDKSMKNDVKSDVLAK